MTEPSLEALFTSAAQGDAAHRDRLFAAIYDELRRVAQRELRRIGISSTLSPTTLLHEAYLDMSGRGGVAFPDRPHFLAYASRVMRGLIIDHARERRALKRGGAFEITSLPTQVPELAADDVELARIGEALDELARVDARLAEVVDLKFFCGFSFAEVAAMRGVSERTIQRDWDKARIFLHLWFQEQDLIA